ncbi:MAG: glycosyltransferase [Bacteroidota bacterium]
MTLAVGLALVALGTHYAARLGAFAMGFVRSAREADARLPDPAFSPRVTVIVAARDEEAVIGQCVDAILACDYPPDRFEVIVADDDSADATAEAVRGRIRALAPEVPAMAGEAPPETPSRLRLVHVPHDPERLRAHKKRAIEHAAADARGEIVLTTDADCVVPRAWIRSMVGAFEDPGVVFASGPVRYRVHRGTFARFQALDFLGLMACGGGGIRIGQPNLANGASVAWRRDVFHRLGGFSGIDDVTSGDDELLMQKIAYQGEAFGLGTEAVRFVNRPEATVVTEPVPSFGAFLHQRKRWASKGTHYRPQLQAMLVGLWGFLLLTLGAALALPFAPGLAPWVLAALGFKALGDLAVLVPATGRFGQRRLLGIYPVWTFAHTVHTVFVGLMGPLRRGFEWKGRALDR